MDMNFYDCTSFKLPFVTAPVGISGFMESKIWPRTRGVEFSQAHANFYNFCDPQAPDKEFLDRMVLRSIDCASILGVKWLVIHAGTDFDSPRLVADSKRKNIEYFKPVIQYAAGKNVGIAIENLWDFNIAPKRRYTTTAKN